MQDDSTAQLQMLFLKFKNTAGGSERRALGITLVMRELRFLTEQLKKDPNTSEVRVVLIAKALRDLAGILDSAVVTEITLPPLGADQGQVPPATEGSTPPG